jgi:membrane protease subunit HflK
VWLATGLYSVNSDESAVAFLFGRAADRDVGPGIHWHAPWPLGSVQVAQTATSFVMPIGYRLRPDLSGPEVSDAWLTGDTNIVTLRLDVQYRIRSLADFLIAHENPRELLRRAGEHSLTAFLASAGVDDVLTTARQRLLDSVGAAVQAHLDRAGVGIEVRSVSVQELAPPAEGGVRASVQEVQNARTDRERRSFEARSYRAQVLAEATGRAEQLVSEARAARHRRMELARGETSRFLALVREHARAPAVTEQRLYLEAVERLLPRLQTFVVQPDPHGRVNLRLVP